MSPVVLAHGVGDELPLPAWLFAYGAGFAVLIAALALGATWPKPRLRGSGDGPLVTGAAEWVLRILGLVPFTVVLVSALWGVDDSFSNITPFAVYTTFWVGALLLSAVAGDVWRALNPIDTLGLVVLGRPSAGRAERTDRPDPGLWPAAAMLLSFVWLGLAYHDSSSPRVIGVWLVLYVVAALAGALAWGRTWLREGEGFAALFGLVAAMAPVGRTAEGGVRLRPPLSGLAAVPSMPGLDALLFTVLGAILFDGIDDTGWWIRDVVGARSPWGRTAIATVGLLFAIAVVAVVWNAAARLVWEGEATRYLPALVPLVVGGTVALDFELAYFDAYNVVALASDPMGRGWDLFGTIDVVPSSAPSTALVAWVAAGAIALAHVAAVFVLHDRSLVQHRSPRAAARARWPFVAALAVSAAGGLLLVLSA